MHFHLKKKADNKTEFLIIGDYEENTEVLHFLEDGKWSQREKCKEQCWEETAQQADKSK